jgi:hypothetical protein
VGEEKCEDSSGHPRAEIRSAQSEQRQLVVGNGGAKCVHWW